MSVFRRLLRGQAIAWHAGATAWTGFNAYAWADVTQPTESKLSHAGVGIVAGVMYPVWWLGWWSLTTIGAKSHYAASHADRLDRLTAQRANSSFP